MPVREKGALVVVLSDAAFGEEPVGVSEGGRNDVGEGGG